MKKAMTILAALVLVLSITSLAFAIHAEKPSEGQPPEQPVEFFSSGQSAGTSVTLQALVNLLEKKGIITGEELNAEIRKLKQGSK